MKAGNALLDADMATLGRWARSGWAWWTAELRALVPAALRRPARALDDFVAYRGGARIEAVGRGGDTVLVDPGLCLVRGVDLPPLAEADLQRLVQLDADRIFPMPAARLVVAAQAGAGGSVQAVAMPRDEAEAMLAALAQAGVTPARYAVGAADGPAPIDLTRSLVEAGLVPPRRRVAAGWWALAAFLFALNLALLVWRDAQEVERLEALVAEQAPAVNAARSIANRIAGSQRQAAQLAERRRRQDAIGVLGAVTRALPAQAWVQRYAWDGRAIRLTGYKRDEADVIKALRGAGFGDVRAASSVAIAEVPAGKPFDIGASVAAGGR